MIILCMRGVGMLDLGEHPAVSDDVSDYGLLYWSLAAGKEQGGDHGGMH